VDMLHVLPVTGTARDTVVDLSSFGPAKYQVVGLTHASDASGEALILVNGLQQNKLLATALDGQQRPTFDPTAASPSRRCTTGRRGRRRSTPTPSATRAFFTGAAIPVDPNITGGGQATIEFTTQTTDTDLSFSWQWKRGGLRVLAVGLERSADPAV
jgi:hypothetical protein